MIDINDAGLRAGVDGEVRVTSPGYAVLDGARLLIGDEALHNARLLPRWTNNRFWSQLNTNRMANGTDTVRHHADLAFAHLEQIWQTIRDDSKRVVFAVPGFYSKEQLALLLGMARECDIPVASVTDSALMAVSPQRAFATALHLDIFLHRVTLTTLQANDSLRRLDTVTISETGLYTLWDLWANVIASQFIQTSRYDPMHQAVSEQQLYDLLPTWIDGLSGRNAAIFALSVGNVRHEVAISREQLLTACAHVYPQIVQQVRDRIAPGQSASLFVSDRFRGFPGLGESLKLITGADVNWLDEASVFRGLTQFEDHVVSDTGNRWTTSLPIAVQRPAEATVDVKQRFVLLGHHATPIGDALRIVGIIDGQLVRDGGEPACTLYTRGPTTVLENHVGSGLDVNGKPAPSRSELAPGDQITLTGSTLTLISAG